jgi:aminoglycoside phosphotransferase (APT) family kinase protein
VGEGLVHSLLVEQHADLADLPLTAFGSGWDNTLWRLGSDLLVRLPRRKEAAQLTINEQKWLPELAPRLPLPVPAPIRFGRPSDIYPWPWSVVPWFDGHPADRKEIARPNDAAASLGRFLRALHAPAPFDAPFNAYRGVALIEKADTFDERVSALEGQIDIRATRRVWGRALVSSPWCGPSVWIHGDLHPANALVAEGQLTAVIDFGDMCAGDPATDVSAAWMLLPDSAIPPFAAAYGGLDVDLERRALGWAVLFGLMLLAIGLDSRPTYETVGRSTLARVSGHSDRMS